MSLPTIISLICSSLSFFVESVSSCFGDSRKRKLLFIHDMVKAPMTFRYSDGEGGRVSCWVNCDLKSRKSLCHRWTTGMFDCSRFRAHPPLGYWKFGMKTTQDFSIMIQFEDDKFRIPKCPSEMKTTTRNTTEMKLNCRGDERCGWAGSGRWKTLNSSSNLFETIFFLKLNFSLLFLSVELITWLNLQSQKRTFAIINWNSRKLQSIAKSFTSWKMNSQNDDSRIWKNWF